MKSLIALIALLAAGCEFPGEDTGSARRGRHEHGSRSCSAIRPDNGRSGERQLASAERIARRRRRLHDIGLLLKTTGGEVSVYLIPSWLIDRQGMKFASGDVIEISCASMTFDAKPALR